VGKVGVGDAGVVGREVAVGGAAGLEETEMGMAEEVV
jgi:hypothetical protein